MQRINFGQDIFECNKSNIFKLKNILIQVDYCIPFKNTFQILIKEKVCDSSLKEMYMGIENIQAILNIFQHYTRKC